MNDAAYAWRCVCDLQLDPGHLVRWVPLRDDAALVELDDGRLELRVWDAQGRGRVWYAWAQLPR